MRALGLAASVGLALVTAVDWATAQSIASRVNEVRDGVALMSFAARDGVCGDGRNVSMREVQNRYWERGCEPGPVRVMITVRNGRLADIDTYVGGRWRTGMSDVTDLGTVSALEAVEYLLSLVTQVPGVGKDAVFPVILADSVEAWRPLLDIAKDRDVHRDVRTAAVFWVGQAATEEAVAGLSDMVDDEAEDLEVKERAVFALSQLDNNEGVPILIRLVRTHESPSIRKKALFWLGQSEDPRALGLFEEILLKKP